MCPVIDVCCWYQWKREESRKWYRKGHPQGRPCWFQAPPPPSPALEWSCLLSQSFIYKVHCRLWQFEKITCFLRGCQMILWPASSAETKWWKKQSGDFIKQTDLRGCPGGKNMSVCYVKPRFNLTKSIWHVRCVTVSSVVSVCEALVFFIFGLMKAQLLHPEVLLNSFVHRLSRCHEKCSIFPLKVKNYLISIWPISLSRSSPGASMDCCQHC